MPQRTINKAPTTGTVETLRQFLQIKLAEKDLKTRYATVRDRVIDIIQQNGVEDDKGSLYLDLDELGLDDEFGEAKYERRVSINLDPDRAEEILKKKRLYKSVLTTIEVVDEEKIAALYYQGKISDEEWDELYPASETWAVKVSAPKKK